MVHAAEVLERLVRDVKIVLKNFSLAPPDTAPPGCRGDGWRAKTPLSRWRAL